jgi:hypothetical protein
VRQVFVAKAPALRLDQAGHDSGDMRARKERVQHVVRILARMSVQCGEWKFKAERLQRLLPASQRQHAAIDERPFHIENDKRMTNSHGNGPGRR